MKNFTKLIINDNTPIKEALIRLDNIPKNLTLFVENDNNQIIGTLTDGDIRRGFINDNSLEDNVKKFMNSKFFYLQKEQVNVELIKKLKIKKIKLLPVLNNKKNLIKVYDLQRLYSVLPIDAVIMAGGRGRRLRPLTDNIPKPLLKLGNKTIIEHNIDLLIKYGIENIYITLKYLGEQIIEYLENKGKRDVKIHFIKENTPLGTFGSVSLINNFSKEHILVMNADLFTNINLENFYLNFIKENADMAVATVPYNINVPYAVLNLKNNKIISFKEKPTYTYYSNAGIYLIKKNLFELIPVKEYFNATDFIKVLIDKNFRVIHVPIIGYWIDIGKPEDYKKAQEYIKYI